MKLQTKYFGTIDYEQESCISFPNGLVGFESEQQFVLLPFEGSAQSLLCLQSIQTPSLAFVVMDPFALRPDYTPVLRPAELEALGVSDSGELCYYVLCVVKKPASDSTVNLKCPIAINPQTFTAYQVILETKAYEMRHPLSEFAQNEGASSC